MEYRYAVVVVTYNRLELLKECIEHILNQTIPSVAVILIDNCSTDGTYEYLEQNFSGNPQFIIIHEKENTGGAGGFCRGLQTAMETDADWFMLIDDDAILDYDCMEKLTPDADQKECLAYACTVVENGEIALKHRRGEKQNIPLENYKNHEFSCMYASFCGLVVNRKIVEKVGFPQADYFIWWDDTEYSMRINRNSDIIVRPEAKLNHKTKPDPVLSGHQAATWKTYYGTRNHIHALKKHKKRIELAKYLKGILINTTKMSIKGIKDPVCAREANLMKDAVQDGLLNRLGKNPKYLPGQG